MFLHGCEPSKSIYSDIVHVKYKQCQVNFRIRNVVEANIRPLI